MSLLQLMDGLPLWAIFMVSVSLIILSVEVGFRFGRKARESESGSEKVQMGPVVAASLGLLAFMLAFTFGAANSRFDARKRLVLADANAIGTAYLRVDLLPKDDRAELRRLFLDYVTLRIESARHLNTLEELRPAIEEIKRLQGKLWAKAVAVADQKPTPVSSLFLQSLNEMIDLNQERITVGIHHRMPMVFWMALYGLTVLAMGVQGYDAGMTGGRRSVTAQLATALAFSLILLLVVALDRPGHHLVQVGQNAMVDLQQDIRKSLQSPSEGP